MLKYAKVIRSNQRLKVGDKAYGTYTIQFFLTLLQLQNCPWKIEHMLAKQGKRLREAKSQPAVLFSFFNFFPYFVTKPEEKPKQKTQCGLCFGNFDNKHVKYMLL